MYPDGDALRVNHELSICITKALIILGYMEMPEDDQPDDSIWNHPERLEAWFEQVKERRMNPGKSASVEWEDVDMTENELTKEYRKA